MIGHRSRYAASSGQVRTGHSWSGALGPGAGVLVVGLLGAGLLTFVFHAVVAGHVNAATRVGLTRLLIVLLGCTVPLEALFVLVTRETARRAAGPGAMTSWADTARRAVVTGVGMGCIGAVVLTALPGELDGGALGITPLLVVAYVAAVGAGVVPRGVLLGSGRYAPVAGAALLSTTIRIATFVIAAGVGPGLGTVVAALLVGEVASTALLVARASHAGNVNAALDTATIEVSKNELVRASLAFAGVWALLAVQALVAGRYLPTAVSGGYTAGIDLGRVIMFLPQVVAVAAMAGFAADGRAALDALRTALRFSAAAAALVAIVAVALAPSLEAMLGSDARLPRSLVFLFAVNACALGLIIVLVTYYVMRGLSCTAATWGAVGAGFVGAALWHSTAGALATVLVLVVLGALARLVAGPALLGPVSQSAAHRKLHSDDGDLDLTIVVPFFNPGGETLRAHLLELVHTLEREGVRFEVIAVSDGSTDGSDLLARELEPLGVQTLVLAQNRGKGAALRAGLERGRGRYLGFIDADGDIPASQWHEFLELAAVHDTDMVVGSKRHPLSQLHYPALRRVYSGVFQVLVHALFRVDVTDTQTGIKLFRREVLADVLPLLVEQGFVFDLELLVVARRRGWRQVLEAPVRVEYQFHSTISMRTVVRMLAETWAFAVRLHVNRVYDPAPELETVVAVRSLVAES